MSFKDLDSKSQSSFEVPVNFDFFSDLLGRNLLSGNEPSFVFVSTQQALQGKRLVALYFSAHWCPPCRQFTPIFSEFYSTLKEVHPEAMEVVFLSSDRDFNGFQRYFSSMPWLSVPFDERFRKESIGSR
jgi:thiol-disulfide isomerase/thioredoxin